MWRCKSLTACLALGVFLSGCSGQHLRMDSATPPDVKWPVQYETQVALGQCVFSPKKPDANFIAGIGAILLGSAISEGVNRIGVAIDEIAKEKTWQATASRNIEISDGKFGPCIQIVRGWFYLGPANMDDKIKAANETWVINTWIDQVKVKELWQNQLWLAAEPEFLFEGRFESARSQSALTMVPQYVRLGTPFATRFLRSDNERHIALLVTFHEPGQSATNSSNPSASVILGKLLVGKEKMFPELGELESAYNGLIVNNRYPYEADWFSLKLDKTDTPLIVTAVVSEKQDANEFLGFLSAVFKKTEPAITEKLQTALVPEKRELAAESNKQAKEKAANDYDDAFVKALNALNLCKSNTTPADFPKLASDARTAMRDLNKAARATKDKDQPFADTVIEDIKVNAPDAAIKKACENAFKIIEKL